MELMNNQAENFNIVFRNSEFPVQRYDKPTIEFSPQDDNWNDFKYKYTYQYRVFQPKLPTINGRVLLGFLESSEFINSNGQLNKDVDVLDAEKLPNFFTLQGGMEDYREFVSLHTIEKAQTLLIALNDLVALKRSPKTSQVVEQAIQTDVFSLAFMRDNERFFAFHNADSILDGLDSERLSGMSSKFSLTYDLAGFSSPNSIEIDFDQMSILPKRISLLIGRNGLGKSQALRSIVNSLLKGDDNFQDRESGRPLLSRLLAIATPGETANTFPNERKNKRIKYRRLILNRSGRAKASRGFCDLCVQLSRNDELIGKYKRWEIFLESIGFLKDSDKILLPLKGKLSVNSSNVMQVDKRYYYPLLMLGKGAEKENLEVYSSIISNANPLNHIGDNVYPLSSGQLAFIKFIVQACLFIENGSLVLLDEPETHLHPNFISDFVRILNKLLTLTGSFSIIATHSAYFVREVPRTQVHVFKENSKKSVDIIKPTLKTFGADVGTLSYFVFEDEITNGLIEELITAFQQKGVSKKILLRELETELSSDVIMYLRRKLNIGDDNETD
jgi:ABC-type Mn2+/Zn2+ transport system ATPase subunit